MTDNSHCIETRYHDLTFISELNPHIFFDLETIHSRTPKALFEGHNFNPTDLFFWMYQDIKFFGRKTLSPLYLKKKSTYKKCNQITVSMILGLVVSERFTEKGITIFFNPLKDEEKMFLFLELIKNQKTDIYFPYPLIINNREHVQPEEAWTVTKEVANELNEGEVHLRTASLRFLSQFKLDEKTIYDPACSTGKFLDEIKGAFPHVKTIGQDLNQSMIDHAKKHSSIDELHLGNSIIPAVSPESVHFIFFRFLNNSIVSTEEALKLFCLLANCCKNEGFLILFGFTSVLLHREIFEMLNLQIEQTIAYDETNQSIFQFYILKKVAPIPMINFENFSISHFQKSQFF